MDINAPFNLSSTDNIKATRSKYSSRNICHTSKSYPWHHQKFRKELC